jgi:hypothetical protein
MANYEFMDNLICFKGHMSGDKAPNYVRRYCECLDELGWKCFYRQIREPVEFVTDLNFLFYILKWILKIDFDDLSYEVYFQYIMDPELSYDGMIKPEWIPILEKRYDSKLEEEFSEIQENSCLLPDEKGSRQVLF